MNITFWKLFGFVLWMSINADTKFQLHICAFDRVLHQYTNYVWWLSYIYVCVVIKMADLEKEI